MHMSCCCFTCNFCCYLYAVKRQMSMLSQTIQILCCILYYIYPSRSISIQCRSIGQGACVSTGRRAAAAPSPTPPSTKCSSSAVASCRPGSTSPCTTPPTSSTSAVAVPTTPLPSTPTPTLTSCLSRGSTVHQVGERDCGGNYFLSVYPRKGGRGISDVSPMSGISGLSV